MIEKSLQKFIQIIGLGSITLAYGNAYADSTGYAVPAVTPSDLSVVTSADTSDAGITDYDTATNDLVRKDGVRINLPPAGGDGGTGGTGGTGGAGGAGNEDSINGSWPIDPGVSFTGGQWVGGDVQADWQWVYRACNFKDPPNSCRWNSSNELECDGQPGIIKTLFLVQDYMVDDGTGRQISVAQRTCTATQYQWSTWDANYRSPTTYFSSGHPKLIDKNGKNWGNYRYSGKCRNSLTFFKPSASFLLAQCGW